jgi:hypothetical protein
LADDVDDQVLGVVIQIIEGRVFPQGITGSKQYRTEWVQSDQLEALVPAYQSVRVSNFRVSMATVTIQTLPDMTDRRDSKRHNEEDWRCLVRSVDK